MGNEFRAMPSPLPCDTTACVKCGKVGAKFKCSRCLISCYCSKQCQENHWPFHKKPCKSFREQEDKARQQLDRNNCLFYASLDGDEPAVTAMIAEGAEVDWIDAQSRFTSLIAASQHGHLPVVNALIAARAVVDRVNFQ